eukprot:15456188-Alexandrium_andersonii.AAC.1
MGEMEAMLPHFVRKTACHAFASAACRGEGTFSVLGGQCEPGRLFSCAASLLHTFRFRRLLVGTSALSRVRSRGPFVRGGSTRVCTGPGPLLAPPPPT